MKKTSMLLSVALTTFIFSGCSFFDSVIGGVASIHTTRIVLDEPSGGVSQDSDQVFNKDRDILLEHLRQINSCPLYCGSTMISGNKHLSTKKRMRL